MNIEEELKKQYKRKQQNLGKLLSGVVGQKTFRKAGKQERGGLKSVNHY